MSWIEVGRIDEIPDRGSIRLVVGDEPLLVFRSGERIACLAERCPHENGRIADTLADATTAVCPTHGFAFDVASGRCRSFRALEARGYQARVIDGQIAIRVGFWKARRFRREQEARREDRRSDRAQ